MTLSKHWKARGLELLLLVVSLAFSLLLLAARFWYSGRNDYGFLVWNLFLAFIPFAISSLLIWLGKEARLIVLLPFLALWLLFFPNAPYILTDLFHLSPKAAVPLWYDLMLILSFAWNGLMLGFISLADLQRFLERRFNAVAAWVFVLLSLLLGSFGVYLGRFLRWNSWDLLTRPEELLMDVLARFVNPLAFPRTWGMTLILTVFLTLSYLMLMRFSLKANARE
jgi:uncharacterized membrane protein